MATTIEDIQYDEMLSELHFEAVMKNEAQKQCIYVFVEGDSEEVAFQRGSCFSTPVRGMRIKL